MHRCARTVYPQMRSPTRAQFKRLTRAIIGLQKNYDALISETPEMVRKARQHLAFTILVPAGKAIRAMVAVETLDRRGFFDERPYKFLDDLKEILRPNVRFHNVKADRLLNAMGTMERFLDYIRTHEGLDDKEAYLEGLHDWLWDKIDGLGRKATAHLMRNLGMFTLKKAYPIIDVHIHKALEAAGYGHETYSQAEDSFYALSENCDVPVILLDAYFWCSFAGDAWSLRGTDFLNFEGMEK